MKCIQLKHIPEEKYHSVVSRLFETTVSQRPPPSESKLLVRIIEVITQLGFVHILMFCATISEWFPRPSKRDLEVIADVVRYYAHRDSAAYGMNNRLTK